MTLQVRLLRNAFSGITGTALNLVIGFLLMPFIVRSLGIAAFGVLTLVNSIVGYAGLLDVGLGPTVVRAAAQRLAARTPEDMAELNRTLATAFYLYLGIGLIAATIIGISGVAGGAAFKLTPDQVPQFYTVLLIVGLQTCLSFPLSIWNSVVGALQDYHVLNIVGIAGNIARAVLTVIVLLSGGRLIGLTLVGLVLTISSWTAAFVWARRRVPTLAVRWRDWDREQVSALCKVSGVMMIWSMAGYAVHQMDRLIVGLLLPVVAVGTYEIGGGLVAFSRNFVDNWLSTVLPAATDSHTRRAGSELRGLFLTGSRYVMLTSGLFVAPGLLLGAQFISLWMGRSFVASAPVLAFLLIGSTYQSQNLVGHMMLPATGHLRFFGRLMAVYAVTIVSCQLAGGLMAGFVGVAAGTAAGIVLVETWLAPRLWRKFGVSGAEVLTSVYARALSPAVLSMAAVYLSSTFLPPANWPSLAANVCVSLAVHLLATWTIGLTAQERASVRQRIFPISPSSPACEVGSV